MKGKKIVKSTAAIFLVLMTIIPLNMHRLQVNAVSAPIKVKIQADDTKVSLINGSFEEPVVPSNRMSMIFDSSSVPGWETTDSQNRIEIQKNGFLESTTRQIMYAQSGNQWAELNAYENSALYQDVPTTPGTTVHWQVYHKGRQGVDVALVEFGSPGGVLTEQSQMSDGDTDWGLYKGTYVIPEGQTTTRFQFRAVSSAGGDTGLGNYLDNIQFATPSVLELVGTFSEPSIQVKNGVDYHLQVTNTGGMPAANNTFSIKIPAELSYTPGSLTSADATISEESYDEVTRTLTFKTNTIEKDATINMTISLGGEIVTPAATPDTSVTYNDENFDEESYTAEATDASVEITSNEIPVITGDTSTTLQPGDTFDPMNTITATDKEDGDLTSEVRVTSNPVDTSVPGTYEVTYEVTDSDGNTATFTQTVIVTSAPIITGENKTYLNPGDTFDPMSTIAATDKEDGNLTNEVEVTNNPVDTNVPGTYEMTYEVTDSDGNTATFIRTIIVTEAPTITGENETRLNPDDTFDPMSTIAATDKEDGDLTSEVEVISNPVDTDVPGTYEVTYKVTDSDGNVANFTRTVIVTSAPVITGDDTMTINPGDKFDPMADLVAYDKEDGELTESIQIVSNNVDVNTPGIYQVVYEVTDSDGNAVTFTRTVIVEPIIPPNDSGNSDGDNANSNNSGSDIVIQPTPPEETGGIVEKTTEITKEDKIILPETGDHSPFSTVGLGLLLVAISTGGLLLLKRK
ncbi:immunoglobulin-like domain-containing protein [Listeria ivanovii]|uniref:immunoglobulin-like domain-containing protein n=1 Tax=Listeria ivanovii TaxID=1638 RepID=UPI0006905EA6|nr:immunoglobulin-like domain-containing protein [Listeria ivanovii]MBK1965497.1 DUF5011 domain-containing protein [Listeria ivanovii subsp. londoniensis]MBK1983324.1 DUF5011 domain-containing protein [Listeria ivanovii subsp. londoniensis]MBK1994664.1 DUF5011 domain-containing protein [Listeria ivanovii subsp. londoniensis]